MLTKDGGYISHTFPLPVDVTDQSTVITDISGETVQLIVASTGVNDAGSAAGTVVYGILAHSGVLDSTKTRIGSKADTSFSWGASDTFDTEVEFPIKFWEGGFNDGDSRATKMASLATEYLTANGYFCIDYRTGLIIGVKKDTDATETASYSYRAPSTSASVVGTITVDSEFPAAAAASDNFANPTTTNAMAMNMLWDGATWDRAPGTSTDGTLVNLGANNDVVVTQMTDSIDGPGTPVIDSYTSVAISAAVTTANQALVGAPGASKQIWVYGVSFTTAAAGTVSFQDEDDTAVSGVMTFTAGGGMAVPPSGNFAMPIWKVATNKALEVDTAAGADAKGWLTYAIVSV